MKKGRFAVLVEWDDKWHGTRNEVIPDFATPAEAEVVAVECKRLGVKLAAVCKTSAAKKLAHNFNTSRRYKEPE